MELRTPRKIAMAAIGAAAISFGMGLSPVMAADWHDKANYPAKVTAVKFDTGYNITRQTAARWGSWDVAFGSALPTAMFTEGYGNERVTITGLQCTNSVAGSIPCQLALGHADKYNRDICNIFADSSGNTAFPGLTIDCPTGLELAP
jgi:hypothetical protein